MKYIAQNTADQSIWEQQNGEKLDNVVGFALTMALDPVIEASSNFPFFDWNTQRL